MAESYELSAGFERATAALIVLDAKFYSLMGDHVSPEAFRHESAQWLVRAAQSVARDRGRGPASSVVVVQRLCRWRYEGHVTQEQVEAAEEYLAEAEDEGLPDVDTTVSELAPIVREQRQKEALRLGMRAQAQQQDMAEVVQHLQSASRIGQSRLSTGTKVGSGSFEVIKSILNLPRLPFGVPELDTELSGGPPRRTLTVFMGGAGDGKSMALTHLTANAMLQGLFVAYATLELPEPYALARIKANLLGIPIDEIIDGDSIELAQRKMAEMEQRYHFGRAVVAEFSPYATKIDELTDWVKLEEDRAGVSVDALVVDYADKCGHDQHTDYLGMRDVYEGLRDWAVQGDRWSLTASQSKRKEKKRSRQDMDDAADSAHKGRAADLWISLNALEDGTQMEFNIGKNRLGKGKVTVGPLPTEFELGRIAPPLHQGPDEVEDGVPAPF